jgi:hypothetical protein
MANDGMTNEMSDARLRELYARAYSAGAGTGTATPPATAAHPSPEDVLALAQRSLPESRRLALLDHVMACPDCRAEFDMLRAIEAAGGERTAQVRPLPSAWRRMAPLAIAASLALVVGTEGWRRSTARDGEEQVMRGDASGVTVVSPAGEVAAGAPLTFAWQAVPGARRYDLEVLNADGNVVFSAETRDTVVTGARPETILPGADYRWWVRAVLEDGGQPRSEPRAFRIRAE